MPLFRPLFRPLIRACHPGPSATVTAIGCLLGAAEGLPAARVLQLGGMLGLGQLSIGWSNDALDAARDRAVGRRDKPVVTGQLDTRLLSVAAGAALVGCGGLSAGLGRRAAAFHGLLIVGAGWAYNLGLKRTRLSIAPYGAAFGALPHLGTVVADPRAPVVWWRSGAGALLGMAAHCLNVLPDRADDLATGVTGTSTGWSEVTTRRVAVVALCGATGLILRGGRASAGTAALTTAMTVPLVVAVLRGGGRVPFVAVELLALVDTVLLARAVKQAGTA